MGQARETVERFFDLFAQGDLDGVLEITTPECTHVGPSGEQDNAQWREYGAAFRTALPDAHMHVDAWIESGDQVVVEGHFRGTHDGPLATPHGEIPPSGNSIDLPFVDIFRVSDGKLAEHRTYWDQLTMMGQLGVTPGS